MGTHSLIVMRCKHNGKYEIYSILYMHWDGHIDYMGKKIVDILSKYQFVSNIPYGQDTTYKANGVGCLFAQLVSYFKENKVYNCYLVPISILEDSGDIPYKYYIDVEDEENNIINIGIEDHEDIEIIYDSLNNVKDYIYKNYVNKQ